MKTEEYVTKVIVSIPARQFTVFSNENKKLCVKCETPEQFQDVLDVTLINREEFELEFEY